MKYGYGYEYTIDEVKKNLKDVEYRIDSLGSTLKDLMEKKKFLESDLAKDTTVRELTESLENEKKLNSLGFPITPEQKDVVRDYCTSHAEKMHKGKRPLYVYEFYPSPVGTFGACVCTKCRNKAIQECGGDFNKFDDLMREYEVKFDFQNAW